MRPLNTACTFQQSFAFGSLGERKSVPTLGMPIPLGVGCVSTVGSRVEVAFETRVGLAASGPQAACGGVDLFKLTRKPVT